MDVAGLRKLLDEATERPWATHGACVWSPGGKAMVAGLSEPHPPSNIVEHVPLGLGSPDHEQAFASGDLLVAAVNALPALLAEADLLRELVEGEVSPDDPDW